MPQERSPAALPQYARIARDLTGRIQDGTYGPGALLPSRNEIVTAYGVSAITARDALAMVCQQGHAKAIRGRGHIVRRKRARLTLPPRLYTAPPDPGVPMEARDIDAYQETPPDNIALPLETGAAPVWVRRAVSIAAEDRQPIQIHVSWLPGLDPAAGKRLRRISAARWPEAVQQITGRTIAAIVQHIRARGANPFEAAAFGLPDGFSVLVAHATTYDRAHQPIEHSRFTWPVDAVRITDHYRLNDYADQTAASIDCDIQL